MTVGTSIFLLAVGAILRYAVDDAIEGVDLPTIGLILMIAGVVGLGLVVPWMSVSSWEPGTPTEGYDAVGRSLGGIYLAQLAFGVVFVNRV